MDLLGVLCKVGGAIIASAGVCVVILAGITWLFDTYGVMAGCGAMVVAGLALAALGASVLDR
jgi:hypothetical protein